MKKIILIFVIAIIASVTYSCVKTAEAGSSIQYTDEEVTQQIDNLALQISTLVARVVELEDEISQLSSLSTRITALEKSSTSSSGLEVFTPMVKTLETYNTDGEKTMNYEYTYDEDNRVKTWTIYSQGMLTMKYEYEYDDNKSDVYITNSDGVRYLGQKYEYYE